MDAVAWLLVALVVCGIGSWYFRRRESRPSGPRAYLADGPSDGSVVAVDNDQLEMTTPDGARYQRTGDHRGGHAVFTWFDPQHR